MDRDGDGYGSSATPPTTREAVLEPFREDAMHFTADANYRGCTPPGSNYVRNNNDLDDNDPQVTTVRLYTYYRDSDGDGYGNPSSTTRAATKPPGYVTNRSDLDDDNQYITTTPVAPGTTTSSVNGAVCTYRVFNDGSELAPNRVTFMRPDGNKGSHTIPLGDSIDFEAIGGSVQEQEGADLTIWTVECEALPALDDATVRKWLNASIDRMGEVDVRSEKLRLKNNAYERMEWVDTPTKRTLSVAYYIPKGYRNAGTQAQYSLGVDQPVSYPLLTVSELPRPNFHNNSVGFTAAKSPWVGQIRLTKVEETTKNLVFDPVCQDTARTFALSLLVPENHYNAGETLAWEVTLTQPAAAQITYYQDTDEDGYGDPANTTTRCALEGPPSTGVWVKNNNDNCPDEFGPTENKGCPYSMQTIYEDQDEDGLGDPNTTQEIIKGAKLPENWVENNNDECPEEFGPAENKGCPYSMQTIYEDQDEDGLGDPKATDTIIEGSDLPTGWVYDNTDLCPEEFGPAENKGCPEEIVAPPPPVEEEEICAGTTTGQYIAASPSSDHNYVLTKTYQNSEGTNALTSIQYYDGLGRLSQSVAVGAAPSGADLVISQNYDAFGRPDKTYLPTPMEGTAGSYRTAMETNATTHYGVNNPYSQTIYEASPLNRVMEQKAPGNFAANPIKNSYDTNTTGEVNRYNVSDAGAITATTYAAGTLFKNGLTDENGHTTYTYTDLQGRVVLKRGPGTEHAEVHDTYYLYDDYGNLRYVLPPRGRRSNRCHYPRSTMLPIHLRPPQPPSE